MTTSTVFEPGQRIIFDGQYIGILLKEDGEMEHHWYISWEDGTETEEISFPERMLVHANGGRSSAKRDMVQAAFAELCTATTALTRATLEWDEARKKYLATDPCGKKDAHK